MKVMDIHGHHIEKMRKFSDGSLYDVKVTNMERPDGADLLKHCYDCDKWVWVVAYWCSECGTKIA